VAGLSSAAEHRSTSPSPKPIIFGSDHEGVVGAAKELADRRQIAEPIVR
jgi:hypothetical protein